MRVPPPIAYEAHEDGLPLQMLPGVPVRNAAGCGACRGSGEAYSSSTRSCTCRLHCCASTHLGDDATECLKSQGPSSFGFVLAGPCATGAGVHNPLLLSGLALAGANHRDATGAAAEDGVLTAQEIAALDLSGTEWAVLSACDTGVGEIRAGEGVLGLHRAFRVAGVSTLIMTLWPVQDETARDWIRELYAARFEQGRATADAVRAASLALLERLRADGDSTHPGHWAAFVAAGDWR